MAFYNTLMGVSIHAPYAGSDKGYEMYYVDDLGFQSTPPMQGATPADYAAQYGYQFQSTPPMQGATPSRIRQQSSQCCFNPRPLCRERPYGLSLKINNKNVSIHAPYAGSDLRRYPNDTDANKLFQSTPPMQGATAEEYLDLAALMVSIHAPYAGSDRYRECDY